MFDLVGGGVYGIGELGHEMRPVRFYFLVRSVLDEGSCEVECKVFPSLILLEIDGYFEYECFDDDLVVLEIVYLEDGSKYLRDF